MSFLFGSGNYKKNAAAFGVIFVVFVNLSLMLKVTFYIEGPFTEAIVFRMFASFSAVLLSIVHLSLFSFHSLPVKSSMATSDVKMQQIILMFKARIILF